jgi:hypothetical protein
LQDTRFKTDKDKLNDEIKRLREEHKREISDLKAEIKIEKVEVIKKYQ